MNDNIKRLLTIILSIFFSSLLFVGYTSAQEKPILFYGVGCPFCDVVKDEIEEKGLDKEIDIDEKEIYNNNTNARLFQEKIAICGIHQNMAGVPLLFLDGECYIGVDPIVNALEGKVKGTVDIIDEGEGEIDQPVEEENSGRNTLLMIIIIPVALLLTVAIGYKLQKKKKVDNSVISILILTPVILQTLTSRAYAICPVCTAAVGAGLGLSRYLGIDDLIMSLWIGGVVLSAALSFKTFILKKTKLTDTISEILSIGIFYSLLFVTLYFLDIVGNPFNMIWGIDKIVLGIVIGSILFKIGAVIHFAIKKRNSDKSLFPFQKLVIPILFLWLFSLIFYFILY